MYDVIRLCIFLRGALIGRIGVLEVGGLSLEFFSRVMVIVEGCGEGFWRGWCRCYVLSVF